MAEETRQETAVNEQAQAPVETPKIDYEAELAKAMAEIKRMKAVADKNASEAAEYKKKYRSTMDETAQANLEREEADKAMREELEILRRAQKVSETEKQYLAMGYAPELATRAANATYENNVEELIAVQKAVIESLRRTMTAELTKNMPTPPISNSGEAEITQEQFDKMTIAEQVELKNKNPELFNRFTN